MAMANSPLINPVNTAKKGKGKPVGKGRNGGERRVSARATSGKGRSNFVNVGQMLAAPMQTSQQGVPYKVLVGDPNEDPGYLRPPTQQDIEYGDRLREAMTQKKSNVWPSGIDPVLLEQRITAAERQPHGPYWKKDFDDPLRKDQYGPSTLQNIGDLAKSGYEATLGKMVPFAFLPGGGIWKSRWGNRPNEALPMRRADIERGHGTGADRSRLWNRKIADYKHKYYGGPEPAPRKSNVYDELGMPQPVEGSPDYDVGQSDVPLYLKSVGKSIDREFGPAKVPPPGSEWGLPAGSLEMQGVMPRYYLGKETRDLIRGGFPVENLPPEIQDYIKNTMEKPQQFYDLSGGRGGGEEEEEGEGRGGIFNILKLLLGMLGLGGLFGGEKKKKKKGDNKRPSAQPQRIPWQVENRMNRQGYATQHGSAQQGGRASGK